MCLSIPAKVIDIEEDMAEVSIGGTILNAGLQMVENIKIGDYVLLHTGFAIQKISEDEAMETIKILKKMNDLTDK
jgi:hydrogenase expression/formation protein HypC